MFAGKQLTRERGETLSMWYFRCGFCLLPWLWVANIALFWRHREKSEIIGKYVRYSIIAFVISLLFLPVWYAVLWTSFPRSTLWIIQPDNPNHQEGIFSSAVYENVN